MKNGILILVCLVAMCTPSLVAAQTGNDQPKTTAQVIAEKAAEKVDQARALRTKIEEAQPGPKFVRFLTNVQIELTLSDQLGKEPPEKKTVSMIVSSGNWGKIRSSGSIRAVGDAPVGVELNVDARPFVSVEGPIQLELTLNYVPLGSTVAGKDNATSRTGINQSQTVVLQNGKPLIVSQAADPVTDRKVIVEVKATILK